ncbi:MAG: NUDIX hydrolase [Alphaproteobacteria bacterium]|nr:NUDIX hydrolase [Alphaproteobacteria bacterium]
MNQADQTPKVIPRPAASLLVLQGSEPLVLMGMRGAKHKFMPNRLVFPGGAVDPADHSAEVATPMPGHALRRLERAADPVLARALGVAAARELEEETGLSLGNPPMLHGFDYLCRAVTPEPSPVRFDARFLVVDASHVSGELAGSGELEDLRWWGVDEALAMDLAGPQRRVLQRLMVWLAMTPEARAEEAEVATLWWRDWEME